ncbi:MAG: hypothetical protein C0507_00355 [Cyanobacteria bacterium PR.3.49]|nr:hypothetical protein [Cyanobacteria bacterium PR.3.49]
MNIRTSITAAVIAFGCLTGIGAATASATTSGAETITTSAPRCGIHYELTRDRNGRLYCKWAPKPRHNRHDRERRANS